jgi:hypothetical protein
VRRSQLEKYKATYGLCYLFLFFIILFYFLLKNEKREILLITVVLIPFYNSHKRNLNPILIMNVFTLFHIMFQKFIINILLLKVKENIDIKNNENDK